MKNWTNSFVIGLVGAIVVLSPTGAMAGPQRKSDRIGPRQLEPPAKSPAEIAALVRDLGSGQFAIREKATRQLIELGIVTREALQRAASHPDAEVRARARAILVTVCEADFQDRLAAFAADYDGSRGQNLPAWQRFSARYGSTRVARQLFVEMQRAEPELLEALEQGLKPASEVLAERTREILEGDGQALSRRGTLVSLLFVASTEGVDVNQPGRVNLYPYCVRSTYQQTSATPLWPGVLKKLVGHWITKDDTPESVNQNLIFAAQLDMKDEALAISDRVLSREDSDAGTRKMAILLIGRFGDDSHRAILEKLLDDATHCGVAPTANPSKKVPLQIRDVALAVLLHMTEQDLRQYGFPATQPFGASAYQEGALGFADPQAREAALEKWAAWRAEHPES